ncbi:hypothetical protein PZ938_12825 [Luteipulveratus sp. YIM 133132]|uniref:Cell division protein FtsL n=1 Tax=Luteipulveratus flavus TaxID=3031728 RepID=A0ABT6C7E8_9MICO|nr:MULTISPECIES: hypothetical protein [unclassified Luteipulveratus]MDE9366489.1 hypothetical protein [Luteipulveratus sp. YIM 133132]MDF8264237.1 hypothetical protein [Luteipulveratus sp. YIM 133296]
MSQMTAPVTTQRAARLPARRPAARAAAPVRARLRVVTGEEVRHSHTGFGVVCALLMAVGLLAVLLLNTARAEQSFALGNLQQTSDRLSDNEEQLRTDLANVQAPQQLALKAQEMGMVPATEVAYVRTSDKKVLGVATRAPGAGAFTVGTLPNTPASTVAGRAVTAAEQDIVIVKPTPPQPPTTAPTQQSGQPTVKQSPAAGGAASPTAPTTRTSPARPAVKQQDAGRSTGGRPATSTPTTGTRTTTTR